MMITLICRGLYTYNMIISLAWLSCFLWFPYDMMNEMYQGLLFNTDYYVHSSWHLFKRQRNSRCITLCFSLSRDKAGGYGIQALGSTLVEGIKGDYFNVMGFPVFRFAKELVSLYGQPNKET